MSTNEETAGLSLLTGITALVVASTIVLPAERRDQPELTLAAGLALLLLTLLVVLPRRTSLHAPARILPFGFFIVIGLVRDGTGGSASGAEPLVLLPVLWVALYENGIAWALGATGCLALSVILPLILVGSPDYSTSDWRLCIFLVAVAGVLVASLHGWRRTHEESITDQLTGAYNRRQWDEQLPRLVGLAKREDKPLSVAIVDLDHFKKFNDTRGHQAGDRLLASAVAAWLKQLRDVDLLARYGGEEFAIALYDCPSERARDVLDRVRHATPEQQTCSAGVATLHGTGEDPDSLVARADAALYEAKRDRNRTVLSPGIPERQPANTLVRSNSGSTDTNTRPTAATKPPERTEQ